MIKRCSQTLLSAVALLSLILLTGCSRDTEPIPTRTDIIEEEAPNTSGGMQDPCWCDPYDDALDVEIIMEDCTPLVKVPGRLPCYEVNCGPCDWTTEIPTQVCYLQKKSLYAQRCTIEFYCPESLVPCVLGNYQKYVWKSEMGQVAVVECGSGNPWASNFTVGPDGIPNTGDEWAHCPD